MTKISDWAKQDTIDAYLSGNPSEAFIDCLEDRRPWNWKPRVWREAAVDYLVKAYIWHRRMEERGSLAECRIMAFKEAYEWTYMQLAPKHLVTDSMYERGW